MLAVAVGKQAFCFICSSVNFFSNTLSLSRAEQNMSDLINIHYPLEIKNDTERSTFKLELLKGQPETLFADLFKNGEISNLIFYTERPEIWHRAIVNLHPSGERKGNKEYWQLKIPDPEDSDSTMTTVNVYKSGKVMVQGYFKSFQSTFQALKSMVEREDISPMELLPGASRDTDTTPVSTHQEEHHDDTEQTLSPPHQTSVTELKEHFTQLEIELVQLREIVMNHTDKKSIGLSKKAEMEQIRKEQESIRATCEKQLSKDREQHNKDLFTLTEQVRVLQKEKESQRSELVALSEQVKELNQECDNHRREIAVLKDHHGELQQERESNKSQLVALAEELRERDRALDTLKEQMTSLTESELLRTDLSPHTAVSPTQNRQQDDILPPTAEREETSCHTHTGGPTRPDSPTEKADIVLLIDSNGKFIDEKRLFPRHKVAKLWCPNTEAAMGILSKTRLGSPSHILIHTGTNDLMERQERVALSLRDIAEKACHTFPNTKIVMSTLLPRRDFHPQTIQKVNVSISRDCEKWPNVHVAHYDSITVHDLYDHVHLYKEAVPLFTKTLKDVTLNRRATLYRRSNTGASNTQTERHIAGPADSMQRRAFQPRPKQQHLQPPQHRQENNRHMDENKPAHRPRTSSPHVVPPPPPQQQQPGRLYAEVVRGAAGPAHSELRSIQDMLSTLCSHLMGHT